MTRSRIRTTMGSYAVGEAIGSNPVGSPGSYPTVYQPVSAIRGVTSKITDEVHPEFFRKKARRTNPDCGGYMRLQRVTLDWNAPYVSIQTGNKGFSNYKGYSGYLYPSQLSTTALYPTSVTNGTISNLPVTPTTPSLDAMGALGWSKFKPTRQHGSLGVAIGELREGLPISLKDIRRLWLFGVNFRNISKRSKADFAADSYLAVQFGMIPFVKDVQDLVKNILEFDKNLQQLLRDNGRGIRRGGLVRRIEPSITRTVVSVTNNYQYLNPVVSSNIYSSTAGPGSLEFTEKVEQEFRFSGQFRYWISEAAKGYDPISIRRKHQLTRILYGWDPTDPLLFWNLIPWSWLFNWFLPFSSIIDNLNDATDNLVADYAYVSSFYTRTLTATRTYYLVDNIPRTSTAVLEQYVQERIKANPFGFGLTYSGLSAKQLAILAALGWQRFST